MKSLHRVTTNCKCLLTLSNAQGNYAHSLIIFPLPLISLSYENSIWNASVLCMYKKSELRLLNN